MLGERLRLREIHGKSFIRNVVYSIPLGHSIGLLKQRVHEVTQHQMAFDCASHIGQFRRKCASQYEFTYELN